VQAVQASADPEEPLTARATPAAPLAPTTAAERESERLAPDGVARVWAHLPEGTELHGVTPLTATADGELEALLVKTLADGRVSASVYVVDGGGRLVVRLPRASVAEPGVLRVGALQLPLEARGTLEAIECGALDLRGASDVLRLAGMIAEEQLGRVAEDGWEVLSSKTDPDVTLLGVCPAGLLDPLEVPDAVSPENPEEFELVRLLPATLAGWSQHERDWSGRVLIEVETGEGQTEILVVGVAGELPR
jgi:hypothetical protein